MIAVLDLPDERRFRRVHRAKLANLDVAAAHILEKSGVRLHTADAVVQYFDFHAFATLRRQELGKLAPELIVIVDECFDVDVMPRGAHRFPNGGKRLRTVDERGDSIARAQRLRRVSTHRLDELERPRIVAILIERSIQNSLGGRIGERLRRHDRRWRVRVGRPKTYAAHGDEPAENGDRPDP